MVEATVGNIVYPNKQRDGGSKFHKGHLLETETYIGGHVECLESGVFRDDIPCKFNLTPGAFSELIANVDRDLTFAIEVEGGLARRDVENYDEVRAAIVERLELLRDTPRREERPVIYHLDVAAMYPNIILTNRLQPCAVVTEDTCAACDYNRDSNKCKRRLNWTWRGDWYPAKRAEYVPSTDPAAAPALKPVLDSKGRPIYVEGQDPSRFQQPQDSFYAYVESLITSSSAKTLAEPTLIVQEGEQPAGAAADIGHRLERADRRLDITAPPLEELVQRQPVLVDLAVPVGIGLLSLAPPVAEPRRQRTHRLVRHAQQPHRVERDVVEPLGLPIGPLRPPRERAVLADAVLQRVHATIEQRRDRRLVRRDALLGPVEQVVVADGDIGWQRGEAEPL